MRHDMLSPREAAEREGVTETTLRRWINPGLRDGRARLMTVRKGGRIYVRPADLEAFHRLVDETPLLQPVQVRSTRAERTSQREAERVLREAGFTVGD